MMSGVDDWQPIDDDLVECSQCHAAVPRNDTAMLAHSRWHGLNGLGLA